jgi:hypothetical protein
LPLFRPSFFLAEMWLLIESLRGATSLALIDPQNVEHHEPGDYDQEAILRSWEATHRQVLDAAKNLEGLQYWSPDKCQAFYTYGLYRPRMLQELQGENIDVPRLHPARHEGATKSLVVWNIERATVLPRSDLILLERPREKKRLFGRKTVVEEVLVSGEDVWKVLSSAGEFRPQPVPHLVVRRPDMLPGGVLSALDGLDAEPASNARRTELAGVVDFELPAPREVEKKEEGESEEQG